MEQIGDRIFFVVGTSEGSGKTLAAKHLSERFGFPLFSSSVVIEPEVERVLGLAPGTVAAARALVRSSYRDDLVREGDAMRARGNPPGVACVRAGHRIIDGLRLGTEVVASVECARSMGLDPMVICLDRHGRPPSDNTDVPGLRAAADAFIQNDWDAEEPLFAAVDTAIDAHIRKGRRRKR